MKIDSFSELSFLEGTNVDISTATSDFAVKFESTIRIPVEGDWTFYTYSNDGGKKVVDNDGEHYAVEKSGKIHLKNKTYALSVHYFHKSGKTLERVRTGPFLSVSFSCAALNWMSHGHEFAKKQHIPNSLLFFDAMDPNLNITMNEEGFPVYTSAANQVQDLEDTVQFLNSNIEELNNKNAILQEEINYFKNRLKGLRLKKEHVSEIDGSDSFNATEVFKSLEKLKRDYFISLGLAFKLNGGNCGGKTLQEIYERILTGELSVEVKNLLLFM
ncbi:hypothetical protein HK099_007002 [Clydaea vesicula]|uniref:Uncharacterized protein n=1 Tax=Clydaea vesicula TaxID=447962 RepID=A0AAD5U1T3_9FUNG|nr:hypothetical protein HK099_007002 [Clydaea vesicula]